MTDAVSPEVQERPSRWSVIGWWELRRIPFNISLAVAGMGSLIAIYSVSAPYIPAGEDFIEPVLLYALVGLYAIGANAGYTFGWISELVWSGGDPSRTRPFRARAYYLGLAGSIVLTLAPAFIAGIAWLFLAGA